MTIRLTELNSETEWDPDRASANRSRDLKYRPLLPKHNWLFFVIPDLSFPFIAANCRAVSELPFLPGREALRLCAANHALLTEMGGST
jgi:hypothetical protein